MKFKNKIIISFCIIIFVPIFLATLVLFSMQHIQMRAIEQTYGVEGDGYSYFSNSVQLLSRFTREIYREVYKVADNQPEKLEDGAYLEKINQQLEEKASYLIVQERTGAGIYRKKRRDIAFDGASGVWKCRWQCGFRDIHGW